MAGILVIDNVVIKDKYLESLDFHFLSTCPCLDSCQQTTNHPPKPPTVCMMSD